MAFYSPRLRLTSLSAIPRPAAATRMFAAAIVLTALATAMPAAAQGEASAERPGFFTVKETSWVVRTEYNGPRGSFDRDFRNIGLVTLEAQRAWTLHGPLEFRAGGGITYAKGSTSEPFSIEPARNVDILGFNGGVEARVDVLRFDRFRLFVDGSVNLLWTHGTQFPPGGTGVNGYLRAGPGAMFRLNDRIAIETGYHLSHVSNGAGIVAHNPAYNGHGGYLSIRFTGGGRE
jgi:hypothetical protein